MIALVWATVALAGTPWDALDDPGLRQLLSDGMERNGDVVASQERAVASRASAWQGGSALLPSLALVGSTSTNPYDTLGFAFGGLPSVPGADTPATYTTGSGALHAAWDVDLFGARTTSWSASRQDARAAELDSANAQNALAGRIGKAWYDLAATEARLRIVEEQVANQETLLEHARLRLGVAAATGLDVLQQEQQLATTRSLLPSLVAARDAFAHQLAALTGRSTAELPPLPATLPEPPPSGAAVSVDDRPDVQALQARADAAHRRATAAVLSGLPTVRLTAQTGEQFRKMADYSHQSFWNVGTSAQVPLFNGGRVHASARAAFALSSAADAQLEQARLNAAAELAAARSRLDQQAAVVQAVDAQAAAARAVLDASIDRYLAGSTPFLSVWAAQGSTLQAELSAVQARRDWISLYIDLTTAQGQAAPSGDPS